MNPRSILLAVLISLFVTIGCSGKGGLDMAVVHIPDPDLERYIRNTLKIPTGDLHPEDMAGVFGLYLYKITSLEGLQYCLYLEYLFISNSPGIDTSPIQNLPNIISLGINHCLGINIEHLRNLNSLQKLQISNCDIKDITFLEGMTEMGYLNLADNEISDISSLRNMTLLENLDIHNNEIIDLGPLSELRELITIDMRENYISDVEPLKFLIRLHRVALSDNQVSDISGLVENIGLGEGFDPNPQPEPGPGGGFSHSGDQGGGYGGDPADNFDVVYLHYNPLSNYAVNTQIPILEARGVSVYY